MVPAAGASIPHGITRRTNWKVVAPDAVLGDAISYVLLLGLLVMLWIAVTGGGRRRRKPCFLFATVFHRRCWDAAACARRNWARIPQGSRVPRHCVALGRA